MSRIVILTRVPKARHILPVNTGVILDTRELGPCSQAMLVTLAGVLQVENNYDVINNSACRSRWPVFTGLQN